MPVRTTDFIIVGQGLAGTLVAHFLERAGQEVVLIDDRHRTAASAVAAGIINPVTGRRFVKSWRFDEFFTFARQTYRQIERQLEFSCWTDRQLLRALFNAREENNWGARSVLPEVAPHVVDPPQPEGIADKLLAPLSWMELKGAAQVALPELIHTYRKHWKESGKLLEEAFDYTALEKGEEGWRYKNLQAAQVIFCEGQKGRENPWFGSLPFEVSKGEVLEVEIPGAGFGKLLKHKSMLAPLGNDRYWLGSNYEWNPADDQTSESGKQQLLVQLRNMLLIPYKVVTHQAAIRPTVKDRRPFLGRHPDHPGLVIFNGLGTKGASMGPFWASHLVDHLCEGKSLEKEVSINRFF